MFSLAVLALASIATSANAHPIPRAALRSTVREVAPAGYAEGYLEPYDQYNTRYLALNCQSQHNTSFFDDCCHPLLAAENLKDNRKPYCTPSPEASSSAAAAEPTSTVIPSGDDCPDDEDETLSAEPSASADPVKNVASSPDAATDSSSASSSTDTPKPSSTDAPKPSSTDAPKATPSSQPSDNGNDGGAGSIGGIIGQIFKGIATFFYQNGVAGACGEVHSDSDYIVALETKIYNNGEHCGKQIKLTDTATGKSTTATVADECPTCQDSQSIDLSHALFNFFASDGAGIFNVEWFFL